MGAIPSGSDPTGWEAALGATGSDLSKGYDPTAIPGAILGKSGGVGSIMGAGISNLAQRTQSNITSAYQMLVQSNPVLKGWSDLIFGGLNPDGQTPLPMLIIAKIATSLGVPPELITSVESALGEIETLFSGFTGGSSIISQIVGKIVPGGGSLTDLAGFFTGFGSGGSLLGQIISAGGGSGSTLTDLENLFTGFLSSGGGIDWGALVQSLFGVSGGSQSTLTSLGSNLMKLLGNVNLIPSSGSFDPIAAWQQLFASTLTPAGALTSLTQVPTHLFGNIGTTAGASTNALQDADPGFGSPASLAGQGVFTWDGTVDHTGKTGSGSARTTANSTKAALLSVPIKTQPGVAITLGAYAKWSGLVASAGQSIVLACNAYDSHDNLIPDAANRVAFAVTSPGNSSSSYTGNSGGWVFLRGGYQTPAGTAYVRLAVEVGPNVSAGTIWFDDLSLALPGMVDATSLFNFENMAQGIIPGPAMAGFQGLSDMFASFAHLVDGMGSAASLTSQFGLDFSQLFGFIQDLATNADTGGTQGILNTNILNFRQNKSLAAGMHPTSEAMFPLSAFGTAGAMTTTSVTAGNAIGQPFRAVEVAQKGFVEFIASGTGLTNIFVNVFSVNPDTGAKTLLWGSTDQSSLVPTSLGHVKVLIPGASQPTVNAGSNLLLEIVNAGSAAMNVVTKNTGQPTHPTDFPYNVGTSRVLASTGGASPATLADASITHTPNTPYINFGMQSVPSNFVPAAVREFSANGTWTRPGGFVDGDLVDVFILGGGGGGQSGGYGLQGSGGQAGQWRLQTFVIGSDINGTGFPVLPSTTTTLAIVIGRGGGGGVNPYTFQPGAAGTASTVSGAGIATLSAAGGLGGGAGYTGSGTSGQGAGNQTIAAYTAYGGPQTAQNASGPGQPGGGGSAGYPALGNDGGTGHVWIRVRQAGTQ